jgi:hypothetical protein
MPIHMRARTGVHKTPVTNGYGYKMSYGIT